MIRIKQIALGNDAEAYIQSGFTDGLNIISSGENHVGKTLIMQAMMFALGSEPMFPASLRYQEYAYIIDVEINGRIVSILRNCSSFVVKDGDAIEPLETVADFDQYWSDHFMPLPSIVKDGKERMVPSALFEQMAFMPQAKRNTARIYGGYYNKADFMEMVYSLAGFAGRTLDSKALNKIKERKKALQSRRKELTKQAKQLKNPGTALAIVSPTSDREEKARIISELDEIRDGIVSLQNRRNHILTRMKKNEAVLHELNSLNREISCGALECLNCHSHDIGYRMDKADFVFDLTTTDMRKQILRSLKERIDGQRDESSSLDSEIRELQKRFNTIADAREITLEDIFACRENYVSLEDVDAELTAVADELDEIEQAIQANSQADAETKESRKELRGTLLTTMNRVRRTLGAEDSAPDYADLFTSENSPYSGSEATEFLMARMYALVKHLRHQMPILVDSFRAEELSTGREEKLLPFFMELDNQVILTATLKEQEAGKYRNIDGVNDIDLTGYAPNKLLSHTYCDAFKAKVEEFGIKLN